MALYPGLQGSNIGTLLRLIQEERQSSPAAIPPALESGSPIRNIIQSPPLDTESPGSNRVIANRPGLNESVSGLRPDEMSEPGQVLSPINRAPVATPVPTPTPQVPQVPGVPSAPAYQAPAATPVPTPGRAAPRQGQVLGLATRISSAPAPAVQQSLYGPQLPQNFRSRPANPPGARITPAPVGRR